MVGWHYRLNGHEFEKTPEDREGWQAMGSQRVGHDLATEQHVRGPPEFQALC